MKRLFRKKILVACEFSGIVREAFARKGHEVVSCDLLETEQSCSLNSKHYQGDVFDIIDGGGFINNHNGFHYWHEFIPDMIVAFPPCTDLSWSNGAYLREKRKDGRTEKALDFCIRIWNACDKVVMENPRGDLWKWMRPTQIIQPWMFGDEYLKTTCLWLKGVKRLEPKISEEPIGSKYWISVGSKKQRRLGIGEIRNSHDRSRTFQGIADAMANQWG